MTLPAAFALLTGLEANGFTLTAKGGSLIVSPGTRLTGGQTDQIRQLKPFLLALVRELEPGEALCGWDDPCLMEADRWQRLCKDVQDWNAAALERWRQLTARQRGEQR